jgi:hypothetical protein
MISMAPRGEGEVAKLIEISWSVQGVPRQQMENTTLLLLLDLKDIHLNLEFKSRSYLPMFHGSSHDIAKLCMAECFDCIQ